MRFNSPTKRFLLSSVLMAAFSCTIINDKDITSAAQLSKLKWKGLEIMQQTSKGNSTISAKVLYDSTLNIVDLTTGARINRRVRFSLGALGSKLKLRSGTSAKTEFTLSYKEGNQPYTFVIYQGDSAVEIYRFRYDASNRLNRIVTVLDPVDGLPFILATRDSISYDNSFKPKDITRKSPDASKRGIITLTYDSFGLTQVATGPNPTTSTSYKRQQGNCFNGASSSQCGGFNKNTGQPGFGPQVNYQFYSPNNLLNQVSIEDHRKDSGGGGCSGCSFDYATFYFHPLMLVKDQLAFGNDLLMVYLIDWWVPGASNPSSNAQTNEFVTFNFLYGP